MAGRWSGRTKTQEAIFEQLWVRGRAPTRISSLTLRIGHVKSSRSNPSLPLTPLLAADTPLAPGNQTRKHSISISMSMSISISSSSSSSTSSTSSSSTTTTTSIIIIIIIIIMIIIIIIIIISSSSSSSELRIGLDAEPLGRVPLVQPLKVLIGDLARLSYYII